MADCLARYFARGSIRQPTPASAPRTVPQPVSSRSQIDLRQLFGTGTQPTSTPKASPRGEGDIYRPFGTVTLIRTTSGAGSRGKTVWIRCQTDLLPMLRPDFDTASPARGLSVASPRGEGDIYRPFGTVTPSTSTSVASWRGEGDIYRPFGTETLNRTTSGVGARGKTVWNRCQTGLLPMLRPDFGTASPARGLSVASRHGEAVIYRLFGTATPSTSTSVASSRGEGDIYLPFGTGTLNRTTSGAGSRGKTVWIRCQTVLLPMLRPDLLPMLRPDFDTASPARGLSVASPAWRGSHLSALRP